MNMNFIVSVLHFSHNNKNKPIRIFLLFIYNYYLIFFFLVFDLFLYFIELSFNVSFTLFDKFYNNSKKELFESVLLNVYRFIY